MEAKLLVACIASLPAAVAALEEEGTLESLALAAAARDAELLPKKWAYEAYDFYLRMQQRCYGVGLQSHVPKLKQHWKMEQRERHYFKAQRAVVQEGQLAALYSGYSLRVLTGGELPPRSTAAAQLTDDFEVELRAFEEEQGLEPGQLTVQDIQGAPALSCCCLATAWPWLLQASAAHCMPACAAWACVFTLPLPMLVACGRFPICSGFACTPLACHAANHTSRWLPLAAAEEEEEEGDHGYYFDAEPFPTCDTVTDFVVQLLKKVGALGQCGSPSLRRGCLV